MFFLVLRMHEPSFRQHPFFWQILALTLMAVLVLIYIIKEFVL